LCYHRELKRGSQLAPCAASAGTFPPVRRSVSGDGILARSGTVPAKAMRCNARLAFVLWGRRGEERTAACGLESERHVRRYVPNMPEGPCSNSEKTWWQNPANRKSTRERISFGSRRAGPKIEKPNFGTWLNKSCAMRTRVRRYAPLTRCNAVE
jgi:hypothetical protein